MSHEIHPRVFLVREAPSALMLRGRGQVAHHRGGQPSRHRLFRPRDRKPNQCRDGAECTGGEKRGHGEHNQCHNSLSPCSSQLDGERTRVVDQLSLNCPRVHLDRVNSYLFGGFGLVFFLASGLTELKRNHWNLHWNLRIVAAVWTPVVARWLLVCRCLPVTARCGRGKNTQRKTCGEWVIQTFGASFYSCGECR